MKAYLAVLALIGWIGFGLVSYQLDLQRTQTRETLALGYEASAIAEEMIDNYEQCLEELAR